MPERIAVITGANSGIGKITAQELARQGYHVVMVCRNPEKAECAKKEIIEESDNQQVDVVLCDLSSMAEITKKAEYIRNTYSKIDLLVNNAGLLPDSVREETSEGLEYTFAVNHLAYFLLTRELLPLLENADSARIINVASEAHKSGTFNPDDIQLEQSYSTMKAYGNSKLFNIMFTRQLAKNLKDQSITTYSLHPGVVNTNFASESDSFFAKLFNIGRFFMISPEKGAETTIYLCTEPGIESLNGEYFIKSKSKKPSAIARDDNACKKLWELSENILDQVLETESMPV
ncbi:MAG: SDR family oxidoreductase [Balneolaceae bacterium]|nr:SDR family oxidoreductase [Balneolaceae bacterium]